MGAVRALLHLRQGHRRRPLNAAALTAHGFAVLRFDFTGLGGSGGGFANTTFSSNVADLVAAGDALRTHHTTPSLLVGHSLGGAAVLAAAQDTPEVTAVATIGAPADAGHVLSLLIEAREKIEARGEAEVRLAGRTFCIRQSFLDDIAAQPQARRIAWLRRALLVLHAPTDDTVGVDNARQIFDTARHPKSFVSLDGADHLLTRTVDAAYAADVIAAWAGRYVATPPAPQPTEAGPPEPGTVLVTESGAARLAQQVSSGPHHWAADEPTSVPGGGDTGPTPHGLLLSALGACTSMTVRMYADRKGWPLEAVTVRLSQDRIHAKDCGECETEEGRIDRIEREIEMVGPLDEKQRRRLLEVADMCPVHRTLKGEVLVENSLVG